MRGASKDDIVSARLQGIAGRHARQGSPDAEAVAELQAVANGRSDILAEAAGIFLARAEAALYPAWDLRAAELCRAAGADEALIPGWVETVRARLNRPLYSSHD